jgi:hypothetical protein
MLGVQNGLWLYYNGVTRSRRVKAPYVYIAQHATTGSHLAPIHEALPGLEVWYPLPRGVTPAKAVTFTASFISIVTFSCLDCSVSVG